MAQSVRARTTASAAEIVHRTNRGAEDAVGARRIRRGLEVVQEPKRHIRPASAQEEEDRPRDGVGAAGQPIAETRQREEEGEEREPVAPIPGRDGGEPRRKHEQRQARARGRRKPDREDLEVYGAGRGRHANRASPPGRRTGISFTPDPLAAEERRVGRRAEDYTDN